MFSPKSIHAQTGPSSACRPLRDRSCCTVAYSMKADAAAGARLVAAIVLLAFTSCASPAGRPQPAEEPAKPPASPDGAEAGPKAPGERSLILTPVPLPASSAAMPALDDPDEVAAELIQVEQQIRSQSTPKAAYARLGRLQQAAYRKLVANPQYREIALGKAPPELRPVLEANIQAGEKLTSLTKPVARLPSWKIVQPPAADELRAFYAEAERQFGVPWQYLAAIHLVESRMGRIRGTSTAGAQGPMQFIPSTWAAYGRGDINDPKDAILAAGRYLAAAGAPSAMGRALYAYNHSQKYVDAVTAYARQMQKDERAYLAYYEWQVYVRTTSGDVLLEVGYGQ